MGMQPASVAAKLIRTVMPIGAQQVITRRVAASQTILLNDILTVTSGGLLTQAIVDTDLDNGEAVYNAALSLPLYIACEAYTTGASPTDTDTMQVIELDNQVILEMRCVAGGASGTPSAISSTGTDAATLDESEAYALCRVKQAGVGMWYAMGAGQTNGVCRLVEISPESNGTTATYAIVRVKLAA